MINAFLHASLRERVGEFDPLITPVVSTAKACGRLRDRTSQHDPFFVEALL